MKVELYIDFINLLPFLYSDAVALLPFLYTNAVNLLLLLMLVFKELKIRSALLDPDIAIANLDIVDASCEIPNDRMSNAKEHGSTPCDTENVSKLSGG